MADIKINKLLTQYNFNDENDINRIKYIVIHYVGATGDAKGNCNYFNTKYLGASAHYFVGFAGDIWQCVEDEDIAWHCGAKTYKHPECRNSNSIGIEMCVRNKGNLSATSKDWYFEDATVNSTIELTKYLMKKYNVKADHVIRHYDVTGKICPNPYVYNNTKHTWDEFKAAISKVSSTTNTTAKIDTNRLTLITGKAIATTNQMINYIKKVNPNIDKKVIDMIPYYISEGETEGIRGDISFAQSCIETGNFTFKGSAVTLDQNNFGGLGVINRGMKGNSYATPQLGVRAMIQHLKAYANTESLNNPCIDVRFKYVSRGCAPYVEWLGIPENPNKKGWAAGSGYGSKILNVLNNIIIGSSNMSSNNKSSNSNDTTNDELYRVRKTWENATGQKGAFMSLNNAIICAKNYSGYNVYDSKGNMVYSNSGYIVKVDISNLWIRKGPGTNFDKIKFTGVGKFTIVEESNGKGASKWGLLKSYSKNKNGWISLDYAKKI